MEELQADLLISLRMSLTVSLLVLIFISDLQLEVPERVIERDKVTLTCKTTCSLTVRTTFTWYRNGHRLSSRTDQVHLQPVSRNDAGRYHCAVLGQNLHSPEITLNVRYGPKSVSVSISPSGEIVEGSSVTLTCSSDANPPVEYHWFKGTSLVAKGETYTMKKISSVDSGEYKCKCINEHGYKYSAALTLNVLYPPKNISVSVSPSGETAEGSSVTLTCSSDANPPVQNYTWFKEGGSSPVGSGHSYRALQSGFYYCVAQNEHGSQKSAAVTVTVKGQWERKSQQIHQSNVAVRSATSDAAPDPDPSNQDDVHYASVEPLRLRNPRNAESSAVTASAFGADEEVHYASVQHCRDKVVETTEGDYVQYASENLYSNVAVKPATSDAAADPDPSNQDDVHGDDRHLMKKCNFAAEIKELEWMITELCGGRGRRRQDGKGEANDGRTSASGRRRTMANKKSSATANKSKSRSEDLQVEIPERVIEGDKVTLTCKTTCRLTVRPIFTWYRNGHRLSSSTDQLHLRPVSREDAGRYQCSVLGQKLLSPEVTLNVRYGPKTISVSISPSGEIVEGSSVNLTCSSDANPPVEYNWFKGTSLVAKEETYTMEKISSVDSGEYKCRSSNEHGYKYSAAQTLNVLYPPKNISVSISPSFETAEGSSVNLTCSSDANPPVQSYTWFKEGGSSPVGSGHSYRALQSGFYYCVAQNEHGSQKSAAVTVTVKEVKTSVVFAVVGVVAGCGCLFIIIGVLVFWAKRKEDSANPSKENLYSNVAVRSAASDAAPDPDPSNQDDVHYASVEPLRLRNPRNAESSAVTASAFGADEEVHYASVQHCRDKVVETTEGDDVQYASVRFTHPDSTNR
ncbi:hypothetical protein MHYP_G00100220 [Metynnis hypsauchen]